MFHTFTRIGGKSCKVIVDSESCINALSSTLIAKFGLKVLPHPHPYKVTWINSSALEVKQEVPCFDRLCSVLTMDVGNVILR